MPSTSAVGGARPLPRWEDPAHWARLAGAQSQCAPRAAFASILSGRDYVPHAACLASQLRAVGSTCPHILVHDDRPELALSASDMRVLADAHGGADRLIPSSWLFARANLTAAKPKPPSAQAVAQGQAPSTGRRLLTSPRRFANKALAIKLFLWALPPERFARVVFLDLDLLVQHNIDHLLSLEFTEEIAAVHASQCLRGARWEPFNSGVLVIKPSRATLLRLLLRACWAVSSGRLIPAGWPAVWDITPRRFWSHTTSSDACAAAFLERPRTKKDVHGHEKTIAHVCERSLLDQSLINFEFRGSYKRLPYGYNVPAGKWKRPPPVRFDEMAVLHYLSEPKPWSAKARSEWAAYAARESDARSRADPADAPRPWSAQTVKDVHTALMGRWLGACGRYLPGVQVAANATA